MRYFDQMRGGGQSPPKPKAGDIFLSWLGAFFAITVIGAIDAYFLSAESTHLLIGSFGASAVLAFGAIRSPLAQPRNLVGGHVVSAIVGVTCAVVLPGPLWFSAAIAVATAIAAMHATGTLHPPGGATALTAVVGGESIRTLGYFYVLFPCLTGALILLCTAVLFNNLSKNRRYPLYWW